MSVSPSWEIYCSTGLGRAAINQTVLRSFRNLVWHAVKVLPPTPPATSWLVVAAGAHSQIYPNNQRAEKEHIIELLLLFGG
jgi:hypothetical protein